MGGPDFSPPGRFFCKLCVVLLTGFDDYHLSVHSDMATVAKAMACPDSGLEVRDRMWLKITIANAFIGQDTLYLNDRM